MKRKPRFFNALEKRRLRELGVLPPLKRKPMGRVIEEMLRQPSPPKKGEEE